MNKEQINSILRNFVKAQISPTKEDRQFVAKVYDSLKKTLNSNCLQIGSFARYTATHPLHDLDVLYILGSWEDNSTEAAETLKRLEEKIVSEYDNPTNFSISTSLQTHSINLAFQQDSSEVFSVDIVPAYSFSKNEFNDDTYKVPEIIKLRHGKNRRDFYTRLQSDSRKMDWIISDPRGYTTIASNLNMQNSDFRKVVKFLKAWKYNCKETNKEFGLKSFHIEQLVTKYFLDHPSSNLFDAVFYFFIKLPISISKPNIYDRGDKRKFIDEYLDNLSKMQKEKIIEARDGFLIKLESFTENDNPSTLLTAGFYNRVSVTEQFLFDFEIPVLTEEEYNFHISALVLKRKGFREFLLDKIGLIKIDRKIKFRVKPPIPKVSLFKWKVKNDNSSKDPRGEITDHQTKMDPETSKYSGDHYVECYAIINNVCVAKNKQNVKLKRYY